MVESVTVLRRRLFHTHDYWVMNMIIELWRLFITIWWSYDVDSEVDNSVKDTKGKMANSIDVNSNSIIRHK